MFTIGFAGFSGSGKSTHAETLALTLPNCKYEAADKHLLASLNQFREFADEVRGDDPIMPNARLLDYMGATLDKRRKFMNIAEPWISMQIKNDIQIAKQEGFDYFISDSLFMPGLAVWKKFDLKAYITVSDTAKRYYMLSIRPELGCTKERTIERDELWTPAYENIGDDILHLEYNYTEESLERNLITLVNRIEVSTSHYKE